MKIQQIEYAVEVAKALSFSAAAENLYVSQPNISRSISSLEEELGYAIFARSNQGIALTPEGEYFISRADVIVRQLKEIMENKQGENHCTFHIKSSFQHTSASEAYIRLCNELIKSDKLDISYTIGSAKDIIRDVYLNRVHLGIVGLDDKSLKNFTYIASSKNLELKPIVKLAMNVNLRKGHPLLKDGIENFDFTKMANYVHIAYDSTNDEEYPALVYNSNLNLMKRVITVSEKETRRRLVSTTDAFSIGCTLHPTVCETVNWVSIPIPNTYGYVSSVIRKTEPLGKTGERFIELFKEEVAK